MNVPLIGALLVTLLSPVQDSYRPDADGFVRNWLVLAPLAIEGESGMAEIDRAFFANEGTRKPKANDTVEITRSWFTWKPHETADYFIDFRESFGSALSEYVAAYAVTYVTVAEDMQVTLAMGSNDQGKIWLNGKPVLTSTVPRGLEKDSDRVSVTLTKGKNALVFKVINEVNSWQGCIRFLRGEAPVRDVTISLVPD